MIRRPSISNVIAGIAFLVLGYSCRGEGETVVLRHTQVDTVAPQAMLDMIGSGALELSRANKIIRGYESRPPLTIVRTDTLVTPPDTVLQMVNVRGGTLSIAPLIRRDSLYAPEIHRFDVGGCDDGFAWHSGALVCDRARLGHLSAYVEAGAEANPFGPPNPTAAVHAGVAWTPGYRSGWRASIQTDPRGRLAVMVTRGWRLF